MIYESLESGQSVKYDPREVFSFEKLLKYDVVRLIVLLSRGY